jgi:hypothetical protein
LTVTVKLALSPIQVALPDTKFVRSALAVEVRVLLSLAVARAEVTAPKYQRA